MIAINHSEEENVREGTAILEGRDAEEEDDDEEESRGLVKSTLLANVDPAELAPFPHNTPLQPVIFAASLANDEVLKAIEARQMDFQVMLAQSLDDDRAKGMSRGDASSRPPCVYMLQDSPEDGIVGLILAVTDVKSLPGDGERPGLVVKYCATTRSLLMDPDFSSKFMNLLRDEKEKGSLTLQLTFERSTMYVDESP